MATKREEKINHGRVVIYGLPDYEYDKDNEEWTAHPFIQTGSCEVLDIQDIFKDRIVTSRYVLPLSDAAVSTSSEGTVYTYNCTAPYLRETAHLSEVETNIIMGQAFAYVGRTQPVKTPLMMIVLVGILGLLAVIGMIK